MHEKHFLLIRAYLCKQGIPAAGSLLPKHWVAMLGKCIA